MSADFIAAAAVGDIPPDGNKAFSVGGQEILICNTPLGFFAVANKCSHQGFPLEGGLVRQCYLFCPHHAARFDLRDGSTKGKLTKDSIPTYPLRVVGDTIEVCLEASAPDG